MGHEVVSGATPEISFADVSHRDLMVRYFESGTSDLTIGRELSVRLLAHAGYPGDPTTEPLTSKQGDPILDADTQVPLTLADYIPYATTHHRAALQQILGFLFTTPGDPDYKAGQAAYAQHIKPGLAQA